MKFKAITLLARIQFHLDMFRFIFWLSDLATSFIPKDTVQRSLFLDNPRNRKLTRIGLDVSNWLLIHAKRHNDRAGELNAKFKAQCRMQME